MPLEKGNSKEIIERNISELIKAGHKPSQAAAIAYETANKHIGTADDKTEETYLDIINKARESENAAIAIGLKAITLAPSEDVSQLCEITQDENEHLAIYSEILKRYQQSGDDDG